VDLEEVRFPGAGVQLSGTITCPDSASAVPGVVLIGGSGPSDRHNDDPLTPVQASLVRLDDTAARTGRPQQTVVFPGADHRLKVSAGFAAGYLAALSRWCDEPGSRSPDRPKA
jgi:hypothetical protein